MNQVIFANDVVGNVPFKCVFIPNSLVNMSIADALAEGGITDYPNEDFIIQYITPSNTIKTIEVNRETLSIQKIDGFDVSDGGEYKYLLECDPSEAVVDDTGIQIIKQNSVPHERNSWYIDFPTGYAIDSFVKKLKELANSSLLGITYVDVSSSTVEIHSKNPLTFKFIGIPEGSIDEAHVSKNPYQYIKMLLTKHVQNFGYNHTDDNAELNSGLADYKAWIAGTEKDSTVAVYRLRFATNRKASKTRDERVWQNVYICTKGANNGVATLLDGYIAILNGETDDDKS